MLSQEISASEAQIFLYSASIFVVFCAIDKHVNQSSMSVYLLFSKLVNGTQFLSAAMAEIFRACIELDAKSRVLEPEND